MEIETPDRVSLTTLGGGAAEEYFKTELERVLENILDRNTELTAREIVLKVIIKPDEDRSFGRVEIKCYSKLATDKPYATNFYIGKDGAEAVAVEHNPQQMKLDFEEIAKFKGLKVEIGGKK